ncbi:jg1598 [Pararge aegeria aegeria]|uniref:Jg1598 protein n=1 Tax=Pararge aegeria aegeria TaxID=348720 RepID=A0A8S4RXD0_9NEOP|nr:jg1598 [Pararge aegeria aegeria]
MKTPDFCLQDIGNKSTRKKLLIQGIKREILRRGAKAVKKRLHNASAILICDINNAAGGDRFQNIVAFVLYKTMFLVKVYQEIKRDPYCLPSTFINTSSHFTKEQCDTKRRTLGNWVTVSQKQSQLVSGNVRRCHGCHQWVTIGPSSGLSSHDRSIVSDWEVSCVD